MYPPVHFLYSIVADVFDNISRSHDSVIKRVCCNGIGKPDNKASYLSDTEISLGSCGGAIMSVREAIQLYNGEVLCHVAIAMAFSSDATSCLKCARRRGLIYVQILSGKVQGI
jgi:hypothetical protein